MAPANSSGSRGPRVAVSRPESGEVTMFMTLTCEAFDVARSDGQRLVVYQAPPGTPDHEAMLRLSA
ncbi:hypothetical protein AB0H17_17320 [Streptomyces olivoreticuli]